MHIVSMMIRSMLFTILQQDTFLLQLVPSQGVFLLFSTGLKNSMHIARSGMDGVRLIVRKIKKPKVHGGLKEILYC